jgi:coenzyme Q-binding protein COQ10
VARAAWPCSSRSEWSAPDERHDNAVVKRIRHCWTGLFDLVLDLERYPEFVPHCRAVKVFSRQAGGHDRTVIVSRMTVGIAGLDVSYVNRTTGDAAARRIEVTALDGPLRRLHVLWTFEPDGEKWTRVGFSVDYAFDSAILSAIASRAFDAMFGDILAAFERRADRLYA